MKEFRYFPYGVWCSHVLGPFRIRPINVNDNYGCDGDDSDYNKGEDDVEGDKNQDTMMNQGRRMGGRGGRNDLPFLSYLWVYFTALACLKPKFMEKKDRMIYLIFTSLAISYLSVNLIHAIE